MGACYVAIPIMLHGTRKCVGFEAILESKQVIFVSTYNSLSVLLEVCKVPKEIK